MGLLDHKRTWNYTVTAPAPACVDAFIAAFSGKGSLLKQANWHISRGSNSAAATYEGRKGLGAALSILSKTSAQEAETAVGSKVSFSVTSNGSITNCTMALMSEGRSGVAGIMGSTADGRFIRPYMQAVAEHLRALDPSLVIESS